MKFPQKVSYDIYWLHMFHETDLINIQKKTNSVVGYDILVENSNITIYILFLFTLISILNK